MAEWSAIIPVRGWRTGKSRLGLPGIARAMALDTVMAIRACPDIHEVIIVTHDDDVRRDVTDWGCTIVDDRFDGDLNRAIEEGAARRLHAACLVALGDLPSLRPDDVRVALSRCGTTPSFISDAHGTGSTMWLAEHAPVRTHFGERSRARHIESGARELTPLPGDDPMTWARLRRDVDDIVDLADARRLGVGGFTAELLGNDEGAGR
jgi:2-phospho-L-lactate guanylyltransferase